jgi:hypothetical protein
MYRTVFTPTEANNMIPFSIPREWYGRDIEVIMFPLDIQTVVVNERKFKEIPSKYLFDTKKNKFNRDEANEYE